MLLKIKEYPGYCYRLFLLHIFDFLFGMLQKQAEDQKPNYILVLTLPHYILSIKINWSRTFVLPVSLSLSLSFIFIRSVNQGKLSNQTPLYIYTQYILCEHWVWSQFINLCMPTNYGPSGRSRSISINSGINTRSGPAQNGNDSTLGEIACRTLFGDRGDRCKFRDSHICREKQVPLDQEYILEGPHQHKKPLPSS